MVVYLLKDGIDYYILFHCLDIKGGNVGSPGHTGMTSRHVIFALACQDCGVDHGFPVLRQGNSRITLACFSAIWSLS